MALKGVRNKSRADRKSDTTVVKEAVKKIQKVTRATIDRKSCLSTGSTLLNLGCTGYPDGGFWKGGYFFFVGDSSSGKTFFSRTCLAEATLNRQFDNYRLIYDDVEGGALMDTERYFGKKLAQRIEPPAIDANGKPKYSDLIEDFYFNLHDALEGEKPCIYVLDSMDALSSVYEGKKFDEKKKARRGNTKAKGDYGDGKAKINSTYIRRMRSLLEKTGSILLVVSQTRDNIDAGLFESKKTRSGGKSLKFYAGLELWSSVGSALKITVRKKERVIGVISKVAIRKNRASGKVRSAEVPIYYSHGIDDIGSCIDYLVTEGHWTKKKGSTNIDAPDFDLNTNKEAIIKHIEDKNLELDLRQTVTDVWNDIEKACEINRKSRY